MVDIKCEGVKTTLKLSEMAAFQGNLKKRTDKDIDELAQSIKTEGLLMPFAIWPSNDGYKLLDGHGRIKALQKLAEQDKGILEQKLPVIFIQKPTEEEARKALLQITSSYGKITKKGALDFVKTIPNYKAPAINKYVKYQHKPVAKPVNKNKDEAIIRISVPVAYVQGVKDMLRQVDYVKIL